jgi:glycosyltransferase involved in cell wall biosynthesis
LNPGGAQRSLTNLLCSLPRSEKTLLCILGKVYCEGYLREIQNASVPVFAIDCAKVPDSVERLLGLATNRAVSNICFWNVNAETKLLLTKVLALAPTQIVDVSPGPMLFRQLEGAKAFQQEICFSSAQYFSRLDHFVSKYRGGEPPPPYQMQPWKAVMIPNGVRVAASSNGPVASPVPGDPALRIGACCRIVPSNRLEFLIEMVALLIGRFPRVSLTVLGGLERSHRSYWDGLLGRIEAAGLNHIHFVGSQADVSTWLREFKVFVMISEEHGCPNASLEAMAAALPVVTNRVGGTPEQVLDGVNGFLVSDRDPSEMAERVAFLLANPVAAAAFGRAGMQLVQREFSIEKMVQRYVRLFRLGRPSA